MNRREARRARPATLVVLGTIGALVFLALPLAGLVWRAPWSSLPDILTTRDVREALWLSLVCSVSATALCVAFGFPLAWLLARVEFPGRALLRALAALPLVLPPVVGGVALLLAFGRRGLVGQPLDEWFGVRLPFTTAGAILAEAFVALPFFVLTADAALRNADPRFEEAAATLGASPWYTLRRVTLPAIAPSLAAGLALTWARALGEFGATITFAGNFPGRTQTMPLAVYRALNTDRDAAVALSLVLLAVSLAVLVASGTRLVRLRPSGVRG